MLERTLPYSLDATVSLRVEPSGLQFHAEIPLKAIAGRSRGTGDGRTIRGGGAGRDAEAGPLSRW